MRREVGLVVGLLVAASGTVFAGEDEVAQEETRQEPVRHIQVLKDPHDIASFYRSSQSSPFSQPYVIDGDYGYGDRGRYPIASYYRQGGGDGGPFSIAGYYRQGAQGRHSQYWTVQVGQRRGIAPLRFRRVGTRDLCFASPVLFPFATFVSDGR